MLVTPETSSDWPGYDIHFMGGLVLRYATELTFCNGNYNQYLLVGLDALQPQPGLVTPLEQLLNSLGQNI